MDPHEAIAPVINLLGTWRGAGSGHYPTIDDFSYEEEVTYTHNGKPYLIYAQRTWSDGGPMHGEVGYLRPVGDGRIELVMAQPFGVTEIYEGTVENGKYDLSSTTIASTSSAKDIESARRTMEITGDKLTYDFWMATAGVPLTHHLSGKLKRVPPSD